VSSIPQYLAEFQLGRAHDPQDTDAFIRSVDEYASHPETWQAESTRARAVAERFTYENYLVAVCRLLGCDPPPGAH
jgi:hypothetical protein